MHKHFFSNIILHFSKLSLCLFEILSRFNSNAILHLPDHFIISYDLEHLHLNIVYQISLLHPIVCGLACCICKLLVKSMGIYLFPCFHGGECIITHNIVWNVFLFPLLGKSMLVSCFVKANTCLHVFTLTGGYCAHLKWCPHSN